MHRRRVLLLPSVVLAKLNLDQDVQQNQTGDSAPGIILEGDYDPASPIALREDGRIIATSDHTWLLRFRDGEKGQPLRSVPGDGSLVRSLSFSGDGQRLAVGGFLREERRNVIVKPAPRSKDEPIFSKGRFVPIGCRVEFWDTEQGPGHTLVANEDATPVRHVAVIGPEHSVAAIDYRGMLSIWRAGKVAPPESIELPRIPNQETCPRWAVFSDDGKRLATVHEFIQGQATDGRTNPSTRVLLQDFPSRRIRFLENAERVIWSLAIIRDGSRVATGDHAGIVTIWDWSRGESIRSFPVGGNQGVQFLKLSPTGSLIVAGTETAVNLWDCDSGRIVASLRGPIGPVRTAVFLGNRIRLVSRVKQATNQELNRGDSHREFLVVWDAKIPAS